MKKLQNGIAHACVVLSISLLTLWALHVFNPKMQFLSGGPTNVLLLLLCICSLLLAVSYIGIYRGHLARERERAAAEARKRRSGLHSSPGESSPGGERVR